MPRAVPQAASVYWMICSFLKAAVVAAPKVAHNRDGVVIMMLKSPMLITFMEALSYPVESSSTVF